METNKMYRVTYTKRIGGNGSILVRANNAEAAIKAAKGVCATGSDFREPVETDEKYIKPREQGFAGYN